MHWKRMKREANKFCACPLPVHCKDLHNQNIPARLVPVFDRIGENIPGYRCGLRWCNRFHQTAEQHLKNEPGYKPPKKVFFIPFFKVKVTLGKTMLIHLQVSTCLSRQKLSKVIRPTIKFKR